MQNTLAILTFPLAPAESAATCVEASDQDFAASFEDVSQAPPDETAPPDPAMTGLVPALPWIATPLSIPTGAAVAKLADGATDSVDAGPAAVVTDVPLDLQSALVPAVADAADGPDLKPVAVATSVTERDFSRMAELSLPEPPHNLADSVTPKVQSQERLAQDRLADVTLPDASASKVQASRHPRPELPAEVSNAAFQPGSGAGKAAADTDEVTSKPAALVETTVIGSDTKATVSDLQASVPNDQIKGGHDGKPGQALIPARPIDMTNDQPAQIGVAAVEVSDSLEQPLSTGVSEGSKESELTSTNQAQPPQTDMRPQTQTASTFWERFFFDMATPVPDAGLRPEIGIGQPAGTSAGAAVVTAPVTPPSGIAAIQINTPEARPQKAGSKDDDTDALSSTETSAGAKVKRPALSTEAPVAPVPVPVPEILLSDWTDDFGGGRDEIDPALSSLAFLPSGSGSVVTSSLQSAQAFPVLHVAAQLAEVLVQSSENATELALAPEELGHVRLRIERDAANPDRLLIMINVERPETLDLFRRHAAELAEAIRAAGYSGADIGFGQQGQGAGSDRQPGSGSFGSAAPPDESLSNPASPRPPSPRLAAGATLDLRL